jgi:hypothetical protein
MSDAFATFNRGILGPRPDEEEPPEVTIRRGRGDSDAELYEYMRRLWAEQKADNARLKAELAEAKEQADALAGRRCEMCKHCWQPVRDGTFKWGRCYKWPGGLEVRADGCCPNYEPKEDTDA